jgi:hypothetical protein
MKPYASVLATKVDNITPVKVEVLRPIRDWLAAGGRGLQTKDGERDFDYSTWNCGTYCCIGGAICALFGGELLFFPDEVATKTAGLKKKVGELLFFPDNVITSSGRSPYDLSPQEVAKVLTVLMETNILDFSIV